MVQLLFASWSKMHGHQMIRQVLLYLLATVHSFKCRIRLYTFLYDIFLILLIFISNATKNWYVTDEMYYLSVEIVYIWTKRNTYIMVGHHIISAFNISHSRLKGHAASIIKGCER